jgi:hypothetical protein
MGGHDSRAARVASRLLRATAAADATLAIVPRQSDHAGGSAPQPIEKWLIALAALAIYSILPPYLGPLIGLDLDVAASVEVVDHVLPGVVACAGALIARSQVRAGAADGIPALAALGACALAGLFQTVSHATLVLDAGGALRPVDSVVLHASPGPVLLLLSLWLLLAPPAAKPAA